MYNQTKVKNSKSITIKKIYASKHSGEFSMLRYKSQINHTLLIRSYKSVPFRKCSKCNVTNETKNVTTKMIKNVFLYF